ncbi:MAG: hypothetical protein KAY37_14175, partial [Phycisphaerae bacterium]|nr:hypothetical protein [Phycisphaerae bacterium]
MTCRNAYLARYPASAGAGLLENSLAVHCWEEEPDTYLELRRARKVHDAFGGSENVPAGPRTGRITGWKPVPQGNVPAGPRTGR